jgi:hypothetical protein
MPNFMAFFVAGKSESKCFRGRVGTVVRKCNRTQPVGDVPADEQLDDPGIEAPTAVNRISGYGSGHFGISRMPELYDNAP